MCVCIHTHTLRYICKSLYWKFLMMASNNLLFFSFPNLSFQSTAVQGTERRKKWGQYYIIVLFVNFTQT